MKLDIIPARRMAPKAYVPASHPEMKSNSDNQLDDHTQSTEPSGMNERADDCFRSK